MTSANWPLRAVLYGVASWICALRHAGLDLGLDPCFQISVKGEWCLTQKRGATTVGSLFVLCASLTCNLFTTVYHSVALGMVTTGSTFDGPLFISRQSSRNVPALESHATPQAVHSWICWEY